MAKLKKEALTQSDVESFLSTESDFSFEMRVTNLFSEICDEASHGGTYTDPVTQKPRQFDIRARISEAGCHLRIAAECKNLKGHFPLVVSRLPRERSEAYHDIVCYRKKRPEEVSPFSSGLDVDSIIEAKNSPVRYKILRINSRNLVYPEKSFVGKSTTQISKNEHGSFTSNDAEVYEKWAQAISSSHDLLGFSGNDPELARRGVSLTIIMPALIIPDSTLWVVNYDLTGKMVNQPELLERCSIYIGKNISGGSAGLHYSLSHLEVFTFSGLEKFLRTFRSDGVIEEWFPTKQIEEEIAFM